MRALAAAGVIAGLVLGTVVVSADSAHTPASAHAIALVASGSIGPRVDVAADGTQISRKSGGVDAPGVQVAGGEAVARTKIDGLRATGHAEAVARSVTLLDGLVIANGVRREADAGKPEFGRVDGLVIAGETIGTLTSRAIYRLPDDGGLVYVNMGASGLRVVLEKETSGYPAGTDIRIATVRVTVAQGRAARAAPSATPSPTTTPDPNAARRERHRRVAERRAVERRRLAAERLTFPVAGRASVADDWGGPRQIGPHQGNDIFAAFGTPVVAVADGVVEKVGTLPISGNRLWLRTGSDEFFYAHLSVFSPAAENGSRVKAGTVLGYLGNTGDAEPTPPHLHFEIHPGGRRPIDPHEVLLAWQSRSPLAGGDSSSRPGALVEVRDFIAGD